MKTLYLHIGTPKTGTTAIQEFLATNRDELYQSGIIFRPMPFHDYHWDLPYLDKDQALCFTDYDGKSGPNSENRNGYFLHGSNDPAHTKENAKRLEEGLLLIRKWFEEKDSVILSDEDLWLTFRLRPHFDRLITFAGENGITIRIVLYLRHQYEYLDSLYRQYVKLFFFALHFTDFIREEKLSTDYLGADYESCVRKLEALFGEENIIIRCYEPKVWKEKGIDICRDFMDSIGAEWRETYQIPDGGVNPSLSYNQTEFCRMLNEILDPEFPDAFEVSKRFRSVGLDCSQVHSEKKYNSYLSDKEYHDLMERYHEGNCRLAEKYLGRSDLFPGHDGPIRQWLPTIEVMQEDMILFFDFMTARLYRDTYAIRRTNKYLIDQVEDLKKSSPIYQIKRVFRWIGRHLRGSS